jgi:protein gp37
MSKIEWTDETWNPITGCTPISAGCKNCYGARMAKRLAGRYGYPADDPFRPGTFHPNQMGKPAEWKKPRRIFVCSMGDLFHEESIKDIHLFDDLIRTMASARRHTYILLTKRPENAALFLQKKYVAEDIRCAIPNLWLGVTVENADNLWRVEKLLKLRPYADKLFVSVEPMLGPVDLRKITKRTALYWREHNALTGARHSAHRDPGKPWVNPEISIGESLDWVICGAETGAGKRPMELDWARDLRDQCQAAGVPFFFKKDSDGNRELDGREWNEVPS